MKLRNLFACAVASAMALVACQPEETDLGTPSIALSASEVTLSAESCNTTLTVTATRDWTVTLDEATAEWLVVDPAAGTASADPQTVTVSALANDGYSREASVAFTIGMQTKYLTVKQDGAKGSADALVVYVNDFDISKADAKPDLNNNYGIWDNKKGTGSSTVTYSFGGKVSARTTGKASNNTDGFSHYEGSGMNKVFFGSGTSILKINDITLNGTTTNYTLTFGGQKYLQDGDSNFSWDEFKVYVGSDTQKWVPLTMSFPNDADINGDWNLATANITLPSGTTSLGVAFVSTCPSAYSLDDVCLKLGNEAGQIIDFSTGVAIDGTTAGSSGSDAGNGELPEGTGDGTQANPYNAAKAQNVASKLGSGDSDKVAGVYVKGIVKEIKEVSTQYGNATYWITDADGIAKFYVFRGKNVGNTAFTSADQIKVGDNVLVYGDLMNYMGNSPQLGQGNYIVSIDGAGNGGTQEPTVPAEKPAIPAVVTSLADFLAAPVGDTWYKLEGQIVSIANTTYGNITIKDAVGTEVYIYGLTKDFATSNDKSFASISGLTEGDVVTLVGQRGAYSDAPQAVNSFYISHVDGELEVVEGSYTLSFSNVENRTEWNDSKQVWEQNGITLTNDKGSSTSKVADYTAPARFYKSSKLTVSIAGKTMTKIDFRCNSTSYAAALLNSIPQTDNAAINGSVVTVTFISPVSSYVIASLTGGQVRMDSLTVYTK